MDENRRQQLLEQYEDIAFSLLMDDYANDEGKRLLQEFEDAKRNGTLEDIPPELDIKCKNLIKKSFAKQERILWLKQISNSLAKVAVVVLVLLGLSTVTVLSVDAFRIPVLNFLMDQSGKYSSMVFDSDTDSMATQTSANRIVARFESGLPEGYLVTRNTFDSAFGTVFCQNVDNHIIYLEITDTERGVNIDTEDVSYTELDFGNYTAYFREKNGYHLRWLDNQSKAVYTLYSNGLDINTFWEFAYTIIE